MQYVHVLVVSVRFETGLPTELDLQEPERVADSVVQMGLKHVVITAVARDDLKDGEQLFC